MIPEISDIPDKYGNQPGTDVLAISLAQGQS